jgi:hypothetical protein
MIKKDESAANDAATAAQIAAALSGIVVLSVQVGRLTSEHTGVCRRRASDAA